MVSDGLSRRRDPDKMRAVPSDRGQVRCECAASFYGYSQLANVERVADLDDNSTLEHLACERCPSGVLCNHPGSEFYLLLFVKGRWQDFDYSRQDPRRLSEDGALGPWLTMLAYLFALRISRHAAVRCCLSVPSASLLNLLSPQAWNAADPCKATCAQVTILLQLLGA